MENLKCCEGKILDLVASESGISIPTSKTWGVDPMYPVVMPMLLTVSLWSIAYHLSVVVTFYGRMFNGLG